MEAQELKYKKQADQEGQYIDQEGNRWDILVSPKYVIVVIDGEKVQQPLPAVQDWDSFNSLEEAEQAYGLTKITGEINNGAN